MSGQTSGVRRLGESPPATQLEWVLDALDGAVVTEESVGARFTDKFKSLFPPLRWIDMMTQQSPALRPFSVRAVELRADRARAELDTPLGPKTVSCTVDADGIIDMLAIAPVGGAGLTPRLPLEFPPGGSVSGVGQRLIVVAGVPGTGKSTLADRLGADLSVPVFAIDWLLGALTPFGGRSLDHLLDLGEELLTTLAYLVAIVCRCDDDLAHQQRLTSRSRGIPGWHEGGNWGNVRQRRDNFPHWDGEHLEIDGTRPIEANVAQALDWIRRR